MSVAYYPATNAEVQATHGLRPGAVALLSFMRWCLANKPGRLPQVDGGYNKRRIRGSSAWSVHATGRAIDFGMNANTSDGLYWGNLLLFVLLMNAEGLGVQYVIWNRKQYRPGQNPRPYNGVSPHTDHLHIELIPGTADHMDLDWIVAVTKG